MSNKTLCRYLLFLFLITGLSLQVFGYETKDIRIHLEIANMEVPQAPHILEDHLILSYQADKPVRFVGATFSHENYSKIHSFVRNANDIFVLVYPVPDDELEIHYRIVVDGLWMADPVNPKSVKDPSGIILSAVTLPPKELNRWKLVTPVVHKNRKVDFFYFGPPGQTMYVAGTFNNWDPFMYKMKETSPGEYSFSTGVLPGMHFYHFVNRGMFFIDPLNPDKGIDSEGNEVSMFIIPGKQP